MVQPIVIGFKKIPIEIIEASYTLGKNKFFTFFKIILPESKVSILTGCIFSSAHTMGEFGVTYMIGGSIPNETKTISIAIYEAVEAGRYHDAHKYSMLIFFVSILLIYFLLKTNEDR